MSTTPTIITYESKRRDLSEAVVVVDDDDSPKASK